MMSSGLSWQLQWMGVAQPKTFSGLVYKRWECLAYANNNTCMHKTVCGSERCHLYLSDMTAVNTGGW